jgi:hypothetical protein
MENTTASQTARIFNMDEKRKFKKVLFADIETAIAKFGSDRTALREGRAETALAKAPAEAKKLLAAYFAALRNSERSKNALPELGYGVRSDWQNHYGHDLEILHGQVPRPLREFDAETARVNKAVADLKRTYKLKLFAGGEEAKEFFGSLAGELAAIINR